MFVSITPHSSPFTLTARSLAHRGCSDAPLWPCHRDRESCTTVTSDSVQAGFGRLRQSSARQDWQRNTSREVKFGEVVKRLEWKRKRKKAVKKRRMEGCGGPVVFYGKWNWTVSPTALCQRAPDNKNSKICNGRLPKPFLFFFLRGPFSFFLQIYFGVWSITGLSLSSQLNLYSHSKSWTKFLLEPKSQVLESFQYKSKVMSEFQCDH